MLITIDIIIRLIQIFLLIIANVMFHEMFHYMAARMYFPRHSIYIQIGSGKVIYKYKHLKIGTRMWNGCCEINNSAISSEEDKIRLQLFYVSGMFGNLALAFILLFMFPNNREFFGFSYFLYFGNMFLLFPQSDIYKFLFPNSNVRYRLSSEEYINKEWIIDDYILGIYCMLGQIVPFCYLIFIAYYVFFQK